MSHYIVLVKQVPDVSQITDNAFDPETGNLIRTRLPSVINEHDAQALAFAAKMKKIAGDDQSKLIALSMGPPMAADVLRYSLSRIADEAVLLTDRALGGADTVATANPLAYAIRKIVAEQLGGTDDYYVIAGMQSVDGDTAQVPAQLAEELQIPCIAYATDADYSNGKFQFTRIISGGSQVVQVKKLPAVITVAKYDFPLFASFTKTRMANEFKVTQWTAADVGAKQIGIKGSKTRVIRVFPPGKTTRKCQEVKTVKELAAIIAEKAENNSNTDAAAEGKKKSYILPAKRSCKFDRSYEGTGKEIDVFKALQAILKEMKIDDISKIDDVAKEKILEVANKAFHKKALEDMIAGLQTQDPTYTGQVWVMAEHSETEVNPETFELIGKAHDLADSLETKVGVIIVGDNVKQFTDDLIAGGADEVYIVQDPLLKNFDPVSYRKVVADAIDKYKPQIVLYGATPRGRVLAPMVSYRLQCGLTADCTGLAIKDSSRKQQVATLFQTRPALGGNIMATICTKDSTCQMATARPGVMQRIPADPSRKGKVIEHDVQVSEDDISMDIISTEMGSGKVNFDAEVIICGGKGIPNKDTYYGMLDKLCDTIKDKFDAVVEKGATRAAVEQGFIDRVHQVGQTGTAIGPKLYMGIGISGAIQHMIGVANSETIIAINSDPHAPIFKQCDYYIVGDGEKIVNELAKEIKAG